MEQPSLKGREDGCEKYEPTRLIKSRHGQEYVIAVWRYLVVYGSRNASFDSIFRGPGNLLTDISDI
eukprot:scaffold419433_cov20-Prasinocladus_malaysianus.AAC.1